MKEIMKDFQTAGITEFGGRKVETLLDYNTGIDGLPKENVLKFLLEGHGSVVVRPSGTEPKLKTYVTVSAPDKAAAWFFHYKWRGHIWKTFSRLPACRCCAAAITA